MDASIAEAIYTALSCLLCIMIKRRRGKNGKANEKPSLRMMKIMILLIMGQCRDSDLSKTPMELTCRKCSTNAK